MAWYIGIERGQADALNRESAEYHQKYADDRIEKNCPVTLAPLALKECVKKETESAYDHHRADRDILAQEAMAVWAIRMTILTGATLIVTVIGVIFVWRTLLEQRRIGEAQVRAYITVDECSVEPIIRKNSVMWKVRCAIRNSGLSPARRVLATAIVNNSRGGAHIVPDLASGQTYFQNCAATMDMDNVDLKPPDDTNILLFVSIELGFEDVFGREPIRRTLEGADFWGEVPLVAGNVYPLQPMGRMGFDVRHDHVWLKPQAQGG